MKQPKGRGLRLMFYDVSEKRPLGWAWRAGAWLYKLLGWFDAVRGVCSWAEALAWAESVSRGTLIDNLQFWGHGSWGRAYINGAAITHRAADTPGSRYYQLLEDLVPRFHCDSLVWFRTCGTFGTELGQGFAKAWARRLCCSVAGQTFLIHYWHSGTRVTCGETPAWSITEGVKVEGGKRKLALSGPGEPRTLRFWQRKIPKEW